MLGERPDIEILIYLLSRLPARERERQVSRLRALVEQSSQSDRGGHLDRDCGSGSGNKAKLQDACCTRAATYLCGAG